MTFEIIHKLGEIYHRNVVEFQSSQIGLENSDEYEINKESYAKEFADK